MTFNSKFEQRLINTQLQLGFGSSQVGRNRFNGFPASRMRQNC